MLLDSAPSYVIPNNDVTPKKRGTENRVIANIRFLILFLILRLLPGRKLGRDYEIPPPIRVYLPWLRPRGLVAGVAFLYLSCFACA